MINQIKLELYEETLRVSPRLCETIVMKAATALGEFYSRTGCRRISSLLASLVRDDALSKENRLHCYLLMLEVAKVPLEDFPPNLTVFKFDTDVRWDLVDEYLAANDPTLSDGRIRDVQI